LSVVRLMDIMAEAAGKPAGLDQANTISRCVMRKEEEAEHVKQEIRVIWGDYLKQPQFERFPNAHELVHRIMLKASACKQGVDRADGVALVDLVNEFADLFWATKGVATERKVCPYPPALEVVRPVL
ncbi:MAG: superoxide dismutase, Ni, partial [Pseudomonadota bacterium]